MNNFPTIANICHIINDKNQVLLQHKARGMGEGKWNGPGGKNDDGESDIESVKREIYEETNLMIEDPVLVATLEYIYENKPDWNMLTHVYQAHKYHGDIDASDEGALKWFAMTELPYEEMWDDDRYWLPRTLLGEKLRMRFVFDEETKKVLSFEYLGKL